jgi:hypothetical protein
MKIVSDYLLTLDKEKIMSIHAKRMVYLGEFVKMSTV